MIKSENGVMSTSDDSVLHLGWRDADGNAHNCTTPLHLHYDADGVLLSCEDAAKFYRANARGQRVIKRVPSVPEWKGPINLPR